MSTVLIFIVATIALSAVVFLVLRKTAKSTAETDPIGYEAAPAPIEIVEPKKAEKKKTSKNTAKNKSLAKIEAKPKKSATKKKK